MEKKQLPLPLEKETQELYFINYQLSNDSDIKNKLIEHNMRLTNKRVYNHFCNTPYDLEDLVSVGYEGLVKSVIGYDIKRNVSFSRYAYKAIDNTIIDYMAKEKKYLDVFHLEENVRLRTNSKSNLEYKDVLGTEASALDNILMEEEYNLVREIVESLKELYGFNDGEGHTLMEVGKKMGMSYQNVSKIVKQTLPIIKEKLEKNDESYKRLVKRR